MDMTLHPAKRTTKNTEPNKKNTKEYNIWPKKVWVGENIFVKSGSSFSLAKICLVENRKGRQSTVREIGRYSEGTKQKNLARDRSI